MFVRRSFRILHSLSTRSSILLNEQPTRQLVITSFNSNPLRIYCIFVIFLQQTSVSRFCKPGSSHEERYFSSKYKKELVKRNPELERFSEASILKTYDAIVGMGFTPENTLKIIAEHPLIIRLQPNTLMERFEMWHICNFSTTQMFHLFTQCPELFEFNDENQLRERIATLKTYVHTDKNIWRLFMQSPNVLIDDLKEFFTKADYLQYEMKVDFTDAVKSGVFGQSLTKLKCRHTLLVRLGIFEPKHKTVNEMDNNKNPRVHRIVDSTDEYFAQHLCGISLAELEAFNALYKRELAEKEEEEALDSDEDEDILSDDDDDVNRDVQTEAFATDIRKPVHKNKSRPYRKRKK